MSGIVSTPSLESHIRSSWKEAHQIWKNTVLNGSVEVALIPSGDGTITLRNDSKTLQWTKIGRQIIITGNLYVEDVPSLPSGHLDLTGLPGPIGADFSYMSAVSLYGRNLEWSGPVVVLQGYVYNADGQTKIRISRMEQGEEHEQFAHEVIAGSQLCITATYFLEGLTASTLGFTGTASGVAHNLLSAIHGDTAPGAVVKGGMVYGDATPKWGLFGPNTTATKKYLSMISSVPSWGVIEAGDYSETDPVFAASAAHGIAAEDITNWNTAYGWGNHASAGYLTSVTPHALLSATHNDTTAAAVVRGDMMIGVGATPKWTRLADVAAGAYFRSGGIGLEPLWSTLILPNAATAFRLPVATAANTIGELAAVGATGKYLAGVTGAIPAWATLNQAAVTDLKITDHPIFDYTDLGGKAIKTTCKTRVYLSAVQYINHDVWTKILLNTESYDTGNNFESYKFTAPVDGYYLICANIYWQGIDVGKSTYVAIYINGVYAYSRFILSDIFGVAQPQYIDIIYLTAGKYVEVYGYYYSAGNTAFASSGSDTTSIAIHLLSI